MNPTPHKYGLRRHLGNYMGSCIDLKFIDHVREQMKREMALHIFDDLVKKGHIKLTEEMDGYRLPGETEIIMQAHVIAC